MTKYIGIGTYDAKKLRFVADSESDLFKMIDEYCDDHLITIYLVSWEFIGKVTGFYHELMTWNPNDLVNKLPTANISNDVEEYKMEITEWV